MDLKKLTKVELETMSYADIAYLILKEGKTLNTAQLFKRVCDLLCLTESQYSQGESLVGF